MELKIDENIVLKSFTVDDAEERYDIILLIKIGSF